MFTRHYPLVLAEPSVTIITFERRKKMIENYVLIRKHIKDREERESQTFRSIEANLMAFIAKAKIDIEPEQIEVLSVNPISSVGHPENWVIVHVYRGLPIIAEAGEAFGIVTKDALEPFDEGEEPHYPFRREISIAGENVVYFSLGQTEAQLYKRGEK